MPIGAFVEKTGKKKFTSLKEIYLKVQINRQNNERVQEQGELARIFVPLQSTGHYCNEYTLPT
jgi:hypothetical protein